MIYRLLAINIGGTLLQSNGKLNRSTKEAIEYVQDKGIHVTLVSSRSFPSAKKVARALKIEGPIIAHQGAFVATEEDEDPLFVERISEETTFDLVKLLESFPCQIRLVHEKYSIANKVKFKNNLIAKAIVNASDPLSYVHQFVDSISETILDEPCAPPKIEVYFENEQELNEVQQVVQSTFSEVTMIPVSNQRIDIVSQGNSKLRGLLVLADHLNITRKQIVAIGNDIDDIEMIEEVGLGVAMGNSPFPVKKAADWITRTNDAQGVAYMVKEHFRKQPPIEFLRKMNIID